MRVNRAFAVARAQGPRLGLALLDDERTIDASGYPYVHLVRGTLLAELGRVEEARTSLLEARCDARNSAEAAQIEDQISQLQDAAS